jgi:hypothetical protein
MATKVDDFDDDAWSLLPMTGTQGGGSLCEADFLGDITPSTLWWSQRVSWELIEVRLMMHGEYSIHESRQITTKNRTNPLITRFQDPRRRLANA